MVLEIRLDNAIIFKSSFPVCRAYRSSIPPTTRPRNLDFVFKPPRAIVWEGYRDQDNTTSPKQTIKGQIWLAGSDPDDLLLGLAFTTPGNIYMNTIHVAHPGKRDQTEVERGLVVTTYPIKRAGERTQ
jgi:hypothetical protein